MTHNTIRNHGLILVFVLIIMVIAISIEHIYIFPYDKDDRIISKISPFVIIAISAYGAYLFQQKSKITEDLRKWWREISESRAEISKYCMKNDIDEEKFLTGYAKLSSSMDILRLIFCNMERNKENPRGYYPFEQVRDMIDLYKSISPDRNPNKIERMKTFKAIEIVFQSLRHAIQLEARATPPDNPTLFDSPHRQKYIDEIEKFYGINIMEIRKNNKKLS